MVDNLCDELCEQGVAIAMFYCDFRDQREQTATNIMGAILKQLVVKGGEAIAHGRRFRRQKRIAVVDVATFGSP